MRNVSPIRSRLSKHSVILTPSAARRKDLCILSGLDGRWFWGFLLLGCIANIMPPASRALLLICFANPQLALWAGRITPASPAVIHTAYLTRLQRFVSGYNFSCAEKFRKTWALVPALLVFPASAVAHTEAPISP